MADSRARIMASIQAALPLACLPGAELLRPVNAVARPSGDLASFVTEVELLSGQVLLAASSGEAVGLLIDQLRRRSCDHVLAWTWDEIGCDSLALTLQKAGIRATHDGSPRDLASIPVGLTGAEAALADTGTLVLRNGPGRSPLASLLPPLHIALLDAKRIFPNMQSYFDSLPVLANHIQESSNLVFISGPSRTGDIEQVLTLGVHGPRELIIIVWQ